MAIVVLMFDIDIAVVLTTGALRTNVRILLLGRSRHWSSAAASWYGCLGCFIRARLPRTRRGSEEGDAEGLNAASLCGDDGGIISGRLRYSSTPWRVGWQGEACTATLVLIVQLASGYRDYCTFA